MRWSITGLAVGCLLAGGCSFLEKFKNPFVKSEGPTIRVKADPVETRDVTWRGWSAIEQTNGLITLRHVPDAGGRTLSLEISGDDAFLVFPDEQAKTYPADSRDNSVHFGGHYTCIGPERIWNVHEQPFNPNAGPYYVYRRTSGPDDHELRFTSRPDTWRGATISIDRKITMNRGNTHVVIDETVRNRGPDPLEFYIWDFTQIDAADRRRPDRPLRRLSLYVPLPRQEGRKRYHSFLPPEPKMNAQFDERLPDDVLAIHYAAQQFKIASHADAWWIAAVDHDTGWTYVKAFEPRPDPPSVYVDGNGPIEVYGAGRDRPLGGSFVEMELLTGVGRYPSGKGPAQREHWYATICKGPVVALTSGGVVCQRMTVKRDKNYYDLSGRFGVFYLGSARLRVEDRKGAALFVGEPILIDPRREFTLVATLPVTDNDDAIVLEVFDYQHHKVGELARADVR